MLLERNLDKRAGRMTITILDIERAFKRVEVSSQEGRIDALVETDSHLYLFEFKKNRSAQAAFDQIKTNKYAEHFALSQKQIQLIGVAFNLRKKALAVISFDRIFPMPKLAVA
jgi:PD-(D/E)XK nuclease superfamily